tara:strand:+ start:8838 stop:9479 length:642 start_codon:yes stop_codon:yes gene_type:complete
MVLLVSIALLATSLTLVHEATVPVQILGFTIAAANRWLILLLLVGAMLYWVTELWYQCRISLRLADESVSEWTIAIHSLRIQVLKGYGLVDKLTENAAAYPDELRNELSRLRHSFPLFDDSLAEEDIEEYENSIKALKSRLEAAEIKEANTLSIIKSLFDGIEMMAKAARDCRIGIKRAKQDILFRTRLSKWVPFSVATVALISTGYSIFNWL